MREMATQKIDKQRKRMNDELAKIVSSFNNIDEVMNGVRHSRGAAHISLRPISGMFVSHGKTGFTAFYQDKDGINYSIGIYRR